MISSKISDASTGHSKKAPSIRHIFNDEFRTLSDDELRLFPVGQSIFEADENYQPGACPLQPGGTPRLSGEGEYFLFRKMNYLKWRANEIASGEIESEYEEEVDDLLEDAISLRNQIAESNIGLVRALARKFSLSATHFDELQSEGFEILLKAINLFDCSRGYRFSTYATHAVQRHYYRVVKRDAKRSCTEMRTDSEILGQVAAGETDVDISAWIENEERLSTLIATMGDHLEERERLIVADRFGLNADGVVKSLRQLGEELGISKERARQLQLSAIGKLRVLFHQLPEGQMSGSLA
jgi:RNA polymerase primary sigma factor